MERFRKSEKADSSPEETGHPNAAPPLAAS